MHTIGINSKPSREDLRGCPRRCRRLLYENVTQRQFKHVTSRIYFCHESCFFALVMDDLCNFTTVRTEGARS